MKEAARARGEKYMRDWRAYGLRQRAGQRTGGLRPAVSEVEGDGRPRRGEGGRETGLEAAVAPGLVHVGELKKKKKKEKSRGTIMLAI